MRKYIQNFSVYSGEKTVPQEKAITWLSRFQGAESIETYEKYAVKPDHILERKVYAPGVGEETETENSLYSLEREENPTMSSRSKFAQEKCDEIFSNLYSEEKGAPDHINHISCTHYQSPSAAQKITVTKEWESNTVVTHLYHMGCYAAFPAVRVSKSYISDGSHRVDNVHTELCSFHLDRDDISIEQSIMNTLFADGAIKYSVVSEKYFLKSKKDGIEIIAQKEVLVSNSENEMTWKLGSHGFIMTLSKKIPLMIAKRIKKYMKDLFSEAGLNFDQDKERILFAVHPGGPRIIELVQKVLELEDNQVKHSNKILRSRGNMSSATIPHIWNEILEDKDVRNNTYVASVAFGPGLTITGSILKVCKL
jgi:predicted naringenin-chalcone synthase